MVSIGGPFGRRILLLCMIAHMLSSMCAYAGWSSPATVVQGNWGTNVNEFGFSKGETVDYFPDTIAVLSDGKVLIRDGVNNVLKIFDSSGALVKTVNITSDGFYGLDADRIVSGKFDDQWRTRIGVYSVRDDKWLWVDNSTDIGNIADCTVYVDPTNLDIYIWNNRDKGYRYSASGTLSEVFTSKPLIFGQEITSQLKADGNYRTVVKFNDITYDCKTSTPFSTFIRDMRGYLYGIGQIGEEAALHTRVYKITKCGKVMAAIDFPPDRRHGNIFSKRLPAYSKEVVDEEYGSPVITPNGEVYTWKRTPDKYSILRWTWVNDPDAPKCPEEKNTSR